MVDDYSDAIRREVRFSLLDSRIRRMVTESDICQSVFARFCLGLWAGTYQVEQPEQLVGLLKTMVRAKVVDWTRHAKAQRRDVRRSVPMDTQVGQVQAARDRTPSQIVSDGEVLDRLRQNLSERELKILDWRQQQYQWPQIADMLGGQTSPECSASNTNEPCRGPSKPSGCRTYSPSRSPTSIFPKNSVSPCPTWA